MASDDVLAGESLAAADLCIGTELQDTLHPTLSVIRHDGQLPTLPEYHIVLYRNDEPPDALPQVLARYLVESISVSALLNWSR
ncbi:MAG: hypothetical protein R3E95_04755 [Thiolinea sp.]